MTDQTENQKPEDQNEGTEGQSQDQGGEASTSAIGINSSAPSVEVKPTFAPASPEAKKAPAAAPVAQAQATSSQNVTKVEQQLVSYMDGMTPFIALDPKVGGQYQNFLFNTLRTVLNNQDQDQFRREWITILNVFNKNKEGVFHENYIMRFPQHWNLSDSEGALFRRLIAVIIQTANPDNRASFGSNVRLDTVVEGLNATQKNNFLNFYA